jgi:hypothetical protein
MFNRAKLQEMASVYFVNGVQKIFGCSDGNFFTNEHFANDHAKRNNLQVHTLHKTVETDSKIAKEDPKLDDAPPTFEKKKTIKRN